MNRQIFAHSRRDLLLICIALIEIAATGYGVIRYDELSLSAYLGLMALCIFLNCTNYQCVAHNFIHHPFFSARFLNRVFSVINSVALQAPQSLYRIHHLDHHRHNNDRPDPVTGRVQDRSSTYRYARVRGQEEHILGYAFLGPFRTEFGFLYAGAKKHGDAPLAWVEVVALLSWFALLTALNWRGALIFLLPTWLLGQVAALAENYLEHHHALPGNRLTDSVSSYGRLYNLIWFNNGYHQEHHYRPQVHWTKIRELRSAMLPESERRTVRFAHWFNFKPGQPSRVDSQETADVQ